MDPALVLYALPLAIGILGTLLAMRLLGRRLPVDRSREIHALHALLARREQELEELEGSSASVDAQSHALQSEAQHLTAQVERLSHARDDAERRAAAAAAQSDALRADLAESLAARRTLEDQIRRRNDDVAALDARLSAALDELAAARKPKP